MIMIWIAISGICRKKGRNEKADKKQSAGRKVEPVRKALFSDCG